MYALLLSINYDLTELDEEGWGVQRLSAQGREGSKLIVDNYEHFLEHGD